MCQCRISKVARRLLNENTELKAKIVSLETKLKDLEGENRSYSEMVRVDFSKLKDSVASLATGIEKFLESDDSTELLEKLAKEMESETKGIPSDLVPQ